jgi:hypothetical protein
MAHGRPSDRRLLAAGSATCAPPRRPPSAPPTPTSPAPSLTPASRARHVWPLDEPVRRHPARLGFCSDDSVPKVSACVSSGELRAARRDRRADVSSGLFALQTMVTLRTSARTRRCLTRLGHRGRSSCCRVRRRPRATGRRSRSLRSSCPSALARAPSSAGVLSLTLLFARPAGRERQLASSRSASAFEPRRRQRSARSASAPSRPLPQARRLARTATATRTRARLPPGRGCGRARRRASAGPTRDRSGSARSRARPSLGQDEPGGTAGASAEAGVGRPRPAAEGSVG